MFALGVPALPQPGRELELLPEFAPELPLVEFVEPHPASKARVNPAPKVKNTTFDIRKRRHQVTTLDVSGFAPWQLVALCEWTRARFAGDAVERAADQVLDQVLYRGRSRSAFSRSISRRFLAVKTPHSFRPFTWSAAVRKGKSVPNKICDTGATFNKADIAAELDVCAVS